MDGIDGYVGGWGIVTLLGFVVLVPAGFAVHLATAMVLVLLAFLAFNWAPARVYLGDGGSLPLGYAVAMLATMTIADVATPSRGLAVLLLCGLPAAEVLVTVSRRLIAGTHIFLPDQNHLHHRLTRRSGGPGIASRRLVFGSTLVALLAVAVSSMDVLAGASIFWAVLAAFAYVLLRVYVPGSDHSVVSRKSQDPARSLMARGTAAR
jgi:UDP-GlcNAc:undecaprenyl-phosphate GlcNAc-1-phosphate transferase